MWSVAGWITEESSNSLQKLLNDNESCSGHMCRKLWVNVSNDRTSFVRLAFLQQTNLVSFIRETRGARLLRNLVYGSDPFGLAE